VEGLEAEKEVKKEKMLGKKSGGGYGETGKRSPEKKINLDRKGLIRNRPVMRDIVNEAIG
jgi:hypothetical protein